MEGVKCAGNVNNILTTILMTVNSHVNMPTVVVITRCTQDLVRVGVKRRKKHQNNIPYHEALKLVVDSKTTTYSQAIQRNKSS